MYKWPEYSLVVGEKLVRISIKQHCIEPRQRWYKHSEQMEVKKKRSPKEKEREKKDTRSRASDSAAVTYIINSRPNKVPYLWK